MRHHIVGLGALGMLLVAGACTDGVSVAQPPVVGPESQTEAGPAPRRGPIVTLTPEGAPDALPPLEPAPEPRQGAEPQGGPDARPAIDVTAGPETGVRADAIPSAPEASPADTLPTLPATCAVLSAIIEVSNPAMRCAGNWPGTTYPCWIGCAPDATQPSERKFQDPNTLWACKTFTKKSSENAGQIVCVGGYLVGCNTYCPPS